MLLDDNFRDFLSIATVKTRGPNVKDEIKVKFHYLVTQFQYQEMRHEFHANGWLTPPPHNHQPSVAQLKYLLGFCNRDVRHVRKLVPIKFVQFMESQY